MVIILKEIKINGEWEFFGSVYLKDSTGIYPYLMKHGKQYAKEPASNPSKVYFRFHKPDKARQYNSESILAVRDSFPDFDKLIGSWPFDFPDVLRFPTDMDELYMSYGISDLRMFSWRD